MAEPFTVGKRRCRPWAGIWIEGKPLAASLFHEIRRARTAAAFFPAVTKIDKQMAIQSRKFAMGVVLGCVGVALLASAVAATKENKAVTLPAKIDFRRDIQPILSDNCFACHGPDDKERKAKLRFDRHEAALKPAKSGDFAIVPGDVARHLGRHFRHRVVDEGQVLSHQLLLDLALLNRRTGC